MITSQSIYHRNSDESSPVMKYKEKLISNFVNKIMVTVFVRNFNEYKNYEKYENS